MFFKTFHPELVTSIPTSFNSLPWNMEKDNKKKINKHVTFLSVLLKGGKKGKKR